jgi:hypothetical protein
MPDLAAPQPSAVAWGAIFAGAAGAAATSIVLLSLGAGLGLTAISPWSGQGASLKALTAVGVIWMVVVQWLSAGLGGYLTGRLRTRWALHHEEVYFRDTVHGFLSWAVAIVAVSLVASSLLTSAIGGAARGATQAASANDPTLASLVDTLYRSDNPAPNASSDDVRGETVRLLTRSLSDHDVGPSDRTYLARLVSARTGLSPDDAQKRVDEVVTAAKNDADTARKVAARAAIAMALSLAIGAFIAAVAGALGGHLRDE